MSETVNKPPKTSQENYDKTQKNNWGAVALISVCILGFFSLLGFIIYLFIDEIKGGVTKELISGIGIGMGIPSFASKIWEKIMKSI